MTVLPTDRNFPVQVRQKVDALMREASIPGLSLAITDRDGLLFAGGFGSAALDRLEPASATTSYLWFSMTKLITATAAIRLAEDGQLDLDEPFAGLLGLPATTAATVRQLMSHTAGIANPLPLRWVRPAADAARDDVLLDRLLRHALRPKRPVGGPARYSNVGYLMLGAVITRAAGMPFTDYADQAVLGPAGMLSTGWRWQPKTAATGYLRAPAPAGAMLRTFLPRGVVGGRSGRHLALRPFLVDGAAYGGAVGNVLDAARFARLHLRNGEIDGTAVMSAAGAATMRQIAHPGRPFDHGLGWFRKPGAAGPPHVEHYGAGAGFWNAMRLYPDAGLGAVVMANTTAPYDVDGLFEAIRLAYR